MKVFRLVMGYDRIALGKRSEKDLNEAFAEAFSAMQHMPRGKWPIEVRQLARILNR